MLRHLSQRAIAVTCGPKAFARGCQRFHLYRVYTMVNRNHNLNLSLNQNLNYNNRKRSATIHEKNSNLLWTRKYSRSRSRSGESFFESEAGKSAILVIGSAICLGVFAYQGYMYFLGPGSIYPSEVRKLLRKGGSAYLQRGSNQDLAAAIEHYKTALELLDTKYSSQAGLERGSNPVTGVEARLAEVYLASGDNHTANVYFRDLLNRVFSVEELLDYKLVVAKLASDEIDNMDKLELENVMRGIGTMNRLAESYEAMGDAKASIDANFSLKLGLNPSNYTTIQEYKNADELYTWVLNTVMESYKAHYTKKYTNLEQGPGSGSGSGPGSGSGSGPGSGSGSGLGSELESQTQPPALPLTFDAKTLPRYLSEYMLTSLFYNASNFYSKVGKYGFSAPLLLRSLDLLEQSANSKTEENVCKSCVIMSHLINVANENNDTRAAKKYIIRGKEQAKKFTNNEACLQSLVSFVFADGCLKEQENKFVDARIEYRKALELSKAMGYEEGEANAVESIERVSKLID